jgi:hypothetical protein
MDKITFNAVTGEVIVTPFTPEEEAEHIARSTARGWEKLRERRNDRLSESDIYVQPDRWETYTPGKKDEWSSYRQALRDLPSNTTDPYNPIWPVKPS